MSRPYDAVSWDPPPGKADAVFGTGATRGEKALANLVGLLGAAGIVGLAAAHAPHSRRSGVRRHAVVVGRPLVPLQPYRPVAATRAERIEIGGYRQGMSEPG